MAEYVHQRLEEMLPELEELNKSLLFTPSETKFILKKREAFEYRIRQQTKTKDSFLKYIEYEEKLLKLLDIRRKEEGVDHEITKQIKICIIERIHNLFKVLTSRFSEDVALWERHIQFCEDVYQFSKISLLYKNILRLHSHREDIWVKAAEFERSEKGPDNPESARELLLKGQRVLPNSEIIFLAMYQMELELATTLIERKKVLNIEQQGDSDDAEKDYTEFKIANIVYQKSLELFPGNTKFHLKMLNVCSKFEFASTELKKMVIQLQQIFPNDPDVWNGLAMVQLNRYKKLSLAGKKDSAERCLAMFRKGQEMIQNETMANHSLWGHMCVLELRIGQPDAREILPSVLHLFQETIQGGHLSQDFFVHFVQILTGMGAHEDATSVVAEGLKVYPDSGFLWLSKLRSMSASGIEVAFQDIIKSFRLATRKVATEDSWPLWQYVLHLCAAHDDSQLESFMEEACRNISKEVSQPAKEWCLDWTFRQGGIKKAREIYKSLKVMRPITLEFYRRYIHIENSQPEPNLDLMRGAFEEALAEFGKSNQDVWLNYMEMERTVAGDAVKAGLLHQRALNSLNTDLKESFIRTNALIGLAA